MWLGSGVRITSAEDTATLPPLWALWTSLAIQPRNLLVGELREGE